MMIRRDLLKIAAALPLAGGSMRAWAQEAGVEAWAQHFVEAGVTGTMVVVDERTGETGIHNQARAATRFAPASTFKVPHALFALDAGVVRDEFQTFKWDGQERAITAWNRDQTLRSSMRHSVVWLYQQWARQIGAAQEQAYLQEIGYGNAAIGTAVDLFWLDGSLRISALEQVAFLQRLYRNELPFSVAHQRLVKDVMVNAAGGDWILRAKTGMRIRSETYLGWWVGWVERPDGPVFFALNIDMPGGWSDAPKRKSIAMAILHEIGALPRSSLK